MDTGRELIEKKLHLWINQGASYDWGIMRAGGNKILSDVGTKDVKGLKDRNIVEIASLENAAERWSEWKNTKEKKVVKVKN